MATLAAGLGLLARPDRALAVRPIGIDVSDYQSASINWSTLKNTYGISFGWAKISEGTASGSGSGGGNFTTYAANAKAAGVLIGPYHYARYDLHTGTSGATSEATVFWNAAKNYIKGGGYYIMPMLDVEASFTGYTKTTLSQWVNQWCLTVSNNAAAAGVTGVKPCIYCSSSHAASYLDSTVTQWNTDIADWPYAHSTAESQAQAASAPPAGIAPWSAWQFWQYDDQNVAEAYTTGDGDIFNGTLAQLVSKMVIGGGNNATVVSASVPSGVVTGKTFTATITMNNSGGTVWTNTGANAYKLGSQNPQDNTTWGFNRVAMPSSPVNVGANATFTFTATAPMTAGAYVFSWRMLQEGVQWFGDTYTTFVTVVMPGPGTNYGDYTIDTGNMDSTSRNGSYVSQSTCGLTSWYSYGIPESGSNCTVFNRDIRWMPPLPTYGFTGRGYLTASTIVPDSHATATAKFFAVDAAGNDLAGPLTGTVNGCAYSCSWVTFYNGAVNVTSLGGIRSNTQDDGPPGAGGCSTACGNFPVAYSQMHIQAARWQYMDDWTCVGPYASASVSDTANRSFNEANLYLYPAVDTSHGNVISTLLGLNGNTPGRVTTGDCNNANTLNFGGAFNGVSPAGNAAAYGNTNNADAYGFAWLFAPAGAGPLMVIGSDDGNRLWVNGVLKNDNNASRGLARDQDNTGAISLPAGWSRVLFKVHNFTGGFQGAVSLRNGGNANLNEPSVNYYDLGGYYSYGLGYEQDPWYPQIVVHSIFGVSNPTNGEVFYGNNTTVTASGTSNGQGPVPYWRTMQYQWGYGLGDVDSNYADVSGSPTSANWSHSTPGVTGHRRFHFFAVSQSGRTSFQNSGLSGGSIFQDAGNYARYYDVYVDNLAPLPPTFDRVIAASTNEIDLAWTPPLDQGVNVAPDTMESAGGGSNQDAANWYRVGDVGCQLDRNGSVLLPWGTGTSFSDTGLVANTAYTYALEARDNHSSSRGNWHNTTGQQGTTTAWTLSVPPGPGSVGTSQTNLTAGQSITWSAASGFGPGLVQYYRYAWDQAATYTWADDEPQWAAGTIATMPTSAGTWYLHIKGYNGADVGNGTFDYAVTVNPGLQPAVTGINLLGGGDVHLGFNGAPGQTYLIQAATNLMPPIDWTTISTNTADSNGLFDVSDLNATNYGCRFYRATTP